MQILRQVMHGMEPSCTSRPRLAGRPCNSRTASRCFDGGYMVDIGAHDEDDVERC